MSSYMIALKFILDVLVGMVLCGATLIAMARMAMDPGDFSGFDVCSLLMMAWAAHALVAPYIEHYT